MAGQGQIEGWSLPLVCGGFSDSEMSGDGRDEGDIVAETIEEFDPFREVLI